MNNVTKKPGFFSRVFRLRLPNEVVSKNGRLIIDKNGNVRPNFDNKHLQDKMIEQFGALELENTVMDSDTKVKA